MTFSNEVVPNSRSSSSKDLFSDIAIFVLKGDVKLQLTNTECSKATVSILCPHPWNRQLTSVGRPEMMITSMCILAHFLAPVIRRAAAFCSIVTVDRIWDQLKSYFQIQVGSLIQAGDPYHLYK